MTVLRLKHFEVVVLRAATSQATATSPRATASRATTSRAAAASDVAIAKDHDYLDVATDSTATSKVTILTLAQLASILIT